MLGPRERIGAEVIECGFDKNILYACVKLPSKNIKKVKSIIIYLLILSENLYYCTSCQILIVMVKFVNLRVIAQERGQSRY